MPTFIRLKIGLLKTALHGYGFQYSSSGIFDQSIGSSLAFLFGTTLALCGVYCLEEAQQLYEKEEVGQASEARAAGVMSGLVSLVPLWFFFYFEIFVDPTSPTHDGGQLVGLLRYFLLDEPPQCW